MNWKLITDHHMPIAAPSKFRLICTPGMRTQFSSSDKTFFTEDRIGIGVPAVVCFGHDAAGQGIYRIGC